MNKDNLNKLNVRLKRQANNSTSQFGSRDFTLTVKHKVIIRNQLLTILLVYKNSSTLAASVTITISGI